MKNVMKSGHKGAPWSAAVALFCSAAALAAPLHAQEISAAEKILFQSDHLHNVSHGQTLRYRYVHREQSGPGFSDKVRLDVGARDHGGGFAVSSQFLSGEREVALPAIGAAQGNPVLLGFLEHDLSEMKRLTGGSTSYFRKRIRLALAEAASVDSVTVSYGGRQVQGKKIAIAPYRDDPMQEKMQKYLGKNYVFILSDAVPGSIYQLQSIVPAQQAGQQKGGSTLIEDTLTVDGGKGSS